MSRQHGAPIQASPELKAWLHDNYTVRITSRGFVVSTKRSDNIIVKKPSWGGIMTWARDERVRVTQAQKGAVHVSKMANVPGFTA